MVLWHIPVFLGDGVWSLASVVLVDLVFRLKPLILIGKRPEDHMSNGWEASTRTKDCRGEETCWRNQFLEENKPTVESSAGGNHITEEINLLTAVVFKKLYFGKVLLLQMLCKSIVFYSCLNFLFNLILKEL